jgi:2'-5' RNA ligase
MSTLLNAALVFDDEPSRKFERYSALLAQHLTFDVVLGPRNLPHLTILQFEGEGEASDWRRLSSLMPEPLAISLAGLTFVPAKEGHVWVEIQVLKSAALDACQRALLEAVGARPTHNGLGDAFRPHITLGRVASSPTIVSLPLEDQVVRMKNVRGSLSVGRAGSNYEFVEAV